jgi:hypothetical protein
LLRTILWLKAIISMKKPFPRLVLTLALAGLLTSARAVLLPVAEDTSSTTAHKINATTGKTTTLSVTAKQQAFLIFDLSTLPASLTVSNLTSARLNLYVSSLTTAGDLTVHLVTNEWQENIANANAPGISSAVVGTIPAADVVARTFIEVDVTSAVSNWFNGASNFGLAIVTATGNVRLASKEGLGTGFPALLEIETSDAALLNVSQLTNGTLPLSSLPGVVVTNNETGVTLAGTFSGNGSGLTSLPANVVTNAETGVSFSGTFSGSGSNLTGVALLNSSNFFTQYQTFSNGAAIGFQGASAAPVYSQEALYINSSNAYGTIIGMNGTTAGGHYFELVAAGTADFEPAGSFGIFDYNAVAYRLSINSDGNTGIGTVTPAAKLEVNGNAQIDGIISGDGSGLSNTFNTSTNAVILGSASGVTNTSTHYGTLKIVGAGSTFSNFDSGGNWVDATTNYTGTAFLPVGPGAGVQSGGGDLSSSKIIFQ